MPKLDVAAVRTAILKGQAAAIGSLGPGGRPRTGSKSFVREHLDTILKLRAETGATWAQMVTALGSAHDLRRGDGKSLKGRQLNALVSACLKERARKAASILQRVERPDAAPLRDRTPAARSGVSQPTARIAQGTLPGALSGAPNMTPLTEDEIRRLQRDRHQHLFKRG